MDKRHLVLIMVKGRTYVHFYLCGFGTPLTAISNGVNTTSLREYAFLAMLILPSTMHMGQCKNFLQHSKDNSLGGAIDMVFIDERNDVGFGY
jgi:hypothetical protein